MAVSSPPIDSADSREARFLSSQAERLQSQKSSDSCNDEADRARQFWSTFRSLCSQMRGRINALLLLDDTDGFLDPGSLRDMDTAETLASHYATAARRNEGRCELDTLLREARALQRHALSTSSSVISSSVIDRGEVVNELLHQMLQDAVPDLTQTDLRLIGQEVDNIVKLVDAARDLICPKEKFVFKRYRKAMAELGRLGGEMPASTETAVEESHTAAKDDASPNTHEIDVGSNYGGVLEDVASNCTVEVMGDNAVRIDESRKTHFDDWHARPCSTGSGGEPRPSGSDGSSSYLIRNLENATVLLRGTRPSVHMRHVRNCTIIVSDETHGPVHVTDCHSTVVRCSCFQLRVHESTGVEFRIWARSGPIIEDCRAITFSGDYFRAGEAVNRRNLFWDVKDFNWLRALKKSPNFEVFPLPGEGGDAEEGTAKVRGVATAAIGGEGVGMGDGGGDDIEEDSEDEL